MAKKNNGKDFLFSDDCGQHYAKINQVMPEKQKFTKAYKARNTKKCEAMQYDKSTFHLSRHYFTELKKACKMDASGAEEVKFTTFAGRKN